MMSKNDDHSASTKHRTQEYTLYIVQQINRGSRFEVLSEVPDQDCACLVREVGPVRPGGESEGHCCCSRGSYVMWGIFIFIFIFIFILILMYLQSYMKTWMLVGRSTFHR